MLQAAPTMPANCSHRPAPYFEWFYFHFVTPDGIALNMVLHESDIFGLVQHPYLSMSVLMPGRQPIYLKRELTGITIAKERLYLQVGHGMILENRESIHFDIPFSDHGYFRGKITKLAPPLMIQDGILYEDPTTGRSSHWLVQVPHASFTGILQLEGISHRLSGMAYQDHQWGTVLIQDFASDWVWGHFSNDQLAVVFFQILTRKGQLIERVAFMDKEGRYMGSALETDFLDVLFAAEQPERIEANRNVSFFNRRLLLQFDVASDKLMRSRIDEEYGGIVASYLRWFASARLHDGCGPQPLRGISEYIRIRPAMYGSLSEPKHH